jgi:AcrR family transcriptional regulator
MKYKNGIIKNMKSGRPREFDSEKALDAAMKVFWRKGYEGASLAELTRAMKINRPSLYAAFGDKEELFRKVLARYSRGPVAYIQEALDETTARAVAERLLLGTAEVLGNPKNPRGCLGVQGALACGESSESIRRELISYRQAGEKIILDRFERAKVEGDLPAGADPADLATFIITMIRGMAVDAASGASREELQRVARTAMRAWPQ